MKKYLLLLMLSFITLYGAQTKLKFGVITTVSKSVMEKRLSPFISYLEKETNMSIELHTDYSYGLTIHKFANNSYDLGFVGPAPYVKIKNLNKKSIEAVGILQNCKKGYFKSVIIAKKGSYIRSLDDLKGATFAFGSSKSTLSYYVPFYMLKKSKVLEKLKYYKFLGKHDRVAQYVIIGKFDAGSIKKSVADKYKKYLQIVKESESLDDFAIVVSSKLDKKLKDKIQKAVLKLKDKKILKSLKKSACGFEQPTKTTYKRVKEIVDFTDNFK